MLEQGCRVIYSAQAHLEVEFEMHSQSIMVSDGPRYDTTQAQSCRLRAAAGLDWSQFDEETTTKAIKAMTRCRSPFKCERSSKEFVCCEIACRLSILVLEPASTCWQAVGTIIALQV